MHMAHSNQQKGGGAGQGYFGLCPLRQGYSRSLASSYLSWRELKPVLHHLQLPLPSSLLVQGSAKPVQPAAVGLPQRKDPVWEQALCPEPRAHPTAPTQE